MDPSGILRVNNVSEWIGSGKQTFGFLFTSSLRRTFEQGRIYRGNVWYTVYITPPATYIF